MDRRWLDRRRFAVWGMGRSGRAAANLLARHARDVVVSDIRSRTELLDDASCLEEGVEWVAGRNVIGDAEVIVTSPGLRPGLEIFDEARRQNIPVISEVELAYEVSSATWIGITGTDGKTTTTSLVGAILDVAGFESVVAGNIGTALCDVVEKIGDEGVVVAELSANQLWSCHRVAVDVAAITNIAEDHRDYFDDFTDYPAAKHRLVQLQDPTASVVLPQDDEQLRAALADHCRKGLSLFGLGAPADESLEQAVYFDQRGRGWWRENDDEGLWLDDFSQVDLIGQHNQCNAACAAAICRSLDVSWEAIAQGVVEFSPLSHRMEPVAEIDGVRYIDDSKATNAHASLAGLKGIDGELVVIAGGRDKGLNLEPWADTVARRAKSTIVIGEMKTRMARLLRDRGGEVITAQSLKEAVESAQEGARPGSTVVLSPACSSFDMFSNYKERGRQFQAAVHSLTTT